MGKQLLSINSTVQFQNKHGCMWGIFHMLDYHHWHNVKKVLPHKRHSSLGRKHSRYCKRQNALSNYSDSEAEQFENVDVEPLLVSQSSKKVGATGKSSTRKSKTGLHIENRSKEDSSKGFEPSDESAVETSKLDRDVSSKLKEHADVVEVFRAEKDFLLKFLRDLDLGAKSFRNKKARLTKSGSFPIAASSKMRNLKSRSTFKHKQTEIWAFPKGEKLLAGTQALELFAKDGAYMKEVPLMGDYGMDSAMKHTGFALSSPSNGLNNKPKGWNQLVLHRFKVIKQRIKHALMDFTKNGYHTSLEAFRRRVSYENRLGKEVSQSLEDGMTENISSNEIKASDNDSNKYEIPPIKRTSSLNESMDRYTQLFERSFGKDIKLPSSMSKSLRVTNADNNHTSGNAPKLSKRNLSLPNIESIGFILHEAICDANDAGSIPARTSLDNNKKEETDILVQRKSASLLASKDKPLNDIIETEVKEEDESSARDVTPPKPLSHSTAEHGEMEVTMDHGKDVMDILEASSEDNATDNTRGTERNTSGSSMNDMEADLLKIESRHSVQAKGTNRSSDNYFLHLESDIMNDSNFKYVKHIIELSGFMENDHTQMWHTVNQPLNPSLCSKEIECSGEEEIDKIDHQLLFDIVNESLLEIYEGSSTYFPRPFSFNLRLHPIPKGHRLLKEVWARVNSYLSLTPELDQTLDDVVRRDLESNGWMNLQSEEECVAVELEDMIVDDLLDEIIFS